MKKLTLKRNHICVFFVTKHFPNLQRYEIMLESILEKNHTNVTHVRNGLSDLVVLKFMQEFILERNHTTANYASLKLMIKVI